MLLEADGFYGSGRFDLAFKRYEQVLNIDKYNIAARRGMERVNGARISMPRAAYNEARGDMLRQVDKGWELPVRRFEVGASTIIEQPQIDTRGTSLINRNSTRSLFPGSTFAMPRSAKLWISSSSAPPPSIRPIRILRAGYQYRAQGASRFPGSKRAESRFR